MYEPQGSCLLVESFSYRWRQFDCSATILLFVAAFVSFTVTLHHTIPQAYAEDTSLVEQSRSISAEIDGRNYGAKKSFSDDQNSDKTQVSGDAPLAEQRILLSMHRFLALRFLMALNDPTLNPDSVEGHPVVSEQLPVFSEDSAATAKLPAKRKLRKKARSVALIDKTPKIGPVPVTTVAQNIAGQNPAVLSISNTPTGPVTPTTDSAPTIALAQTPVSVSPKGGSDWDWIPEEFKTSEDCLGSTNLEFLGTQLNELLFSSLQCHLEQLPADAVSEKTWLVQSAPVQTPDPVNAPIETAAIDPVILTPVVAAAPIIEKVRSILVAQAAQGTEAATLPPTEESPEEVAALAPQSKLTIPPVVLSYFQTASQAPSVGAASAPTQVSNQLTTQNDQAEKRKKTQQMATQASAAVPTTGLAPDIQPLDQIQEQMDTQYNPLNHLSLESTYAEAFDPNQTSVIDVQSKMISLASERGWKLSSQSMHWPTLNWVDPLHNFYAGSNGAPIPLLHLNTIRSFEGTALGGTVQQQQTGIVFGKVAAGWDVRFSEQSRTEQPIFLDLAGQLSTAEDSSQDRYFIYLNVAPGAHLIYLSDNKDHGTESRFGNLVIPALSGTATYVDLTQIRPRLLSGTVLNAGQADSVQPFAGVSVQVAGQDLVSTISAADGTYMIKDVITVASYPIVIEADVIRGNKILGFKHRYQVLPENMTDLNLYRMPSTMIKEWVGSLEGGISAESGLLLAAIPGVVNDHPGTILKPSVSSLASTTNLIPETYSLSPAGDLRPPTWTNSDRGAAHPVSKLRRHEVRFLGTQIPEGLAQAQVVGDNDESILWGELIISSPGVVNMVGPY